MCVARDNAIECREISMLLVVLFVNSEKKRGMGCAVSFLTWSILCDSWFSSVVDIEQG